MYGHLERARQLQTMHQTYCGKDQIPSETGLGLRWAFYQFKNVSVNLCTFYSSRIYCITVIGLTKAHVLTAPRLAFRAEIENNQVKSAFDLTSRSRLDS